MRAKLYFDGGSRPTNPGHAGIAALVWLEGKEKAHICSRYIGFHTNNYAEYSGLLVGIKFALSLGVTELDIISDSKLIVEQMNGRWRVKDASLKTLHTEAKKLLESELAGRWTIKWKKRTNNKDADDYCTKAIHHGMNTNPFIPKKIKDKRPGFVIDPFSRVS